MLSNLAVHISNGVFLGFAADDDDHAYLFSLHVPAAPISLLRLQHRFRVIATVDGALVVPPQEEEREAEPTVITTAAARQVVPGDRKTRDTRAVVGGDVALASGNGRYVAVVAPFEHRHALIDVTSGRIRRFLTGRPLVAASWAPVATSSLDSQQLALLCEDGVLTLIDAESPASDLQNSVVISRRLELSTLLARHCPDLIFGNSPAATARDGSGNYSTPADGHPPIAVTFCGPTRGLPMLLFVLSARGDVFGVAVPEGVDEDAAAVEEEAQRRPRSAEIQERSSVAARLLVDDRRPSTVTSPPRHLKAVAGSGGAILARGETAALPLAVANLPPSASRHLIAPKAVGNAGSALALHTFCVDRHAGTHAMVVLHALGIAHLYLLREEEIVAGTEPRIAVPLFRVIFTDGPFPCPVLIRGSSSTEPQRSSVYQAVQSRMQSIALFSDGNLCVVKATFAPNAPQAFLVAFPVWSETKRGWCYMNSSEQRNSHDDARLPVAGWDPQCMPDPLATRVPVDLTQYSVAIGDSGGTLLLFPTQTHPGLPSARPPLHPEDRFARPVMTLSTVDLLENALRAQANSYAMLSSPSAESKPASTKEEKKKSSSNSSLLLSVLNGVASLCDSTVRAVPNSSAAARDALLSEFAATLTECQGRVASTLRQSAQREAALLAKVEQLQTRVATTDKNIQSLRAAGLAAYWAPEGADAFSHVNATLGKIHKALDECEAVVEDRELDLLERKARASKEAID